MRRFGLWLTAVSMAVWNGALTARAMEDGYVTGCMRGIFGESSSISSLFIEAYTRICTNDGYPVWLPLTAFALAFVLLGLGGSMKKKPI